MKHILSAMFCLASVLTAFSDPSLMLSGGVNYSLITGDDSLVTANNLRPGFNAKIGLEQRFVKNFSMIVGLSLETRGEQNLLTKNLSPTIVQEIDEKVNILNLQLPVLAQANFPIGIICINVFAGPDLAVFLSGEKKRAIKVYVPATETAPARTDSTGDIIDFSQKMKMLGLDLEGGVGLEINTGESGAIFIRGGIQMGLIDIAPAIPDPQNYENLIGKHLNGYVTAGYKFNVRFDEE